MAWPTELHLVTNSCWRHSLDLARHATGATIWPLAFAFLAKTVLRTEGAGPEASVEVALGEPLSAVFARPEKLDPNSVEAMLQTEKVSRFGAPLSAVLSDEVKNQHSRAADEFLTALREEQNAKPDDT